MERRQSMADRESTRNCGPDIARADAPAIVQDVAYRGLLRRKGGGRTDASRKLCGDSRQQ